MRNGLQAGPAKNFSATTETVEVLKGPLHLGPKDYCN